MSSKLEEQLDRFLDVIWDEYVHVYCNITYSELYVDKINNNKNGCMFWIVYIGMTLPSLLLMLVKQGFILSSWIVFLICAICLLLPPILKWKNQAIVYSVLGVYDRKTSALKKNAEKLGYYRSSLLALYVKAETEIASGAKIESIESKYQALVSQYLSDMTEFSDLVGTVDKALEMQAQEKTKTMINNTELYGKKK